MLYNYLVELLCVGIMLSPRALSPLKFTDLADWCCTVEPRLLQDPSPGSLEAPGKMVIGCDR